jgi:hypothetical protein
MNATPDSTLADSAQLIADLQRQLAKCRAERDEAFEYQTATSDVLKLTLAVRFGSTAVHPYPVGNRQQWVVRVIHTVQ